jgi:hypothetical protein
VPAGTRVKLLLPGFLLAPATGMPAGAKTRVELADPPPGDAVDLAVLLEIPERTRGVRLKEEAYALLHRAQSNDAAAGAYIATSGGGGRLSTIAAIIGFCVSGAGAGALCVATGVVQTPKWILGEPDRAPAPGPVAKAKPKPRARARVTASSRTTELVPTPTPVPTLGPEPQRRTRKRAAPDASKDPSQGTRATSHESAPISGAPAGTTAEFGPGPATDASTSPTAPAPATGGGEFLP